MAQLEKFIIRLIVIAMAFSFGYNAVTSFIHHNPDAGAIFTILTLLVVGIYKTCSHDDN